MINVSSWPLLHGCLQLFFMHLPQINKVQSNPALPSTAVVARTLKLADLVSVIVSHAHSFSAYKQHLRNLPPPPPT